MGNIEFIRSIGIMVVAAATIVLIARRLNIPNIVLYIVAGLMLGPIFGVLSQSGVEGNVHDDSTREALHLISEFGIALLLFLVGLELSLSKIRAIGKVAVLAGIGQVIFTASVGFVFCIAMQFTVMESIFLATALTFSSTVVVVKLLDQKKELNTLYGRIAVGIFLVQDLVVIIVLTVLVGLGSPEQDGGFPLLLSLVKSFGGTALLLLVAILASKYLLPGPVRWAAQSPETILIWSVFWCFLFVVMAASLGLSSEIGAFLAGLSLAQLPESRDMRLRLHPLMNFFVALFFISLGAGMGFADAAEHWVPSVVLALFVLIGNPLIFMIIIARQGYSERTSFFTSITVAQISEFSFIFVGVGLSSGLIDRSIVSITTVVGLVTIATSAYMILYCDHLYRWARRWKLLRPFKASDHDDDAPVPERSNHIVIVGMNSLGRALAERLHSEGEHVVAIDTSTARLRGLSCETVVGNIEYLDVVEEVGLQRSKLAISALQIEDTNNLFAYRCRIGGVPAAIHVFDRSVMEELRRQKPAYVIDSKSAGSVLLVTALTEEGVLGS